MTHDLCFYNITGSSDGHAVLLFIVYSQNHLVAKCETTVLLRLQRSLCLYDPNSEKTESKSQKPMFLCMAEFTSQQKV